MAQTVAQHSVATFTTPVNGTSPIDANTVRGNDNTLRVGYNDHDSDAGIHLQSSALASRPSAGEAGRKWLTTDTGAIKIFFDTGTAWAEVSYLPSSGGTVSGNLSITGTLGVTGVLTASGGVMGNLTGNVTGNVSGNAGTVTNGLYSTGSYSDPSWLTALAGSKITGDISGNAATATTANKVANALTAGSYLTAGGTFDGAAARTFAVDATDANTANKVVARDSNGDFSARIITAALNGNAATVTDGVYTTGTYSNPAWITALAGSKISGDIAGNAGTATKLATARTINGVSFDGTGNITVPAAAGTLTGSTLASGVTASSLTSVGTLSSLAVSGTTTFRSIAYTWPLADGTSGYVLSTDGAGQLAWVAQSGGGGGGSGTVNNGTTGYFAYYPSTGTVVDDQTVLYTDGTNLGVDTTTLTGGKLNVAGNANLTTGSTYKINGTDVLSATALGSGVTSSSLTSVGTIGTGTWQGTAISDTYLATISTAGKVSNSATTAASANTASAIVARDASGNFSAGTITAALSGNASTATALQTARTINGTSFDGTANITVTAAAGTLTGTTLNSTVVTSSLTSVGTLTSGSIGTGFTAIANSALANSSVTINGTAVSLGGSATVTAAAGTLSGTSLAANVVTSSLTSVGTLTNLTVTNTITGSVSGNAGTATKLATARAINGTNFDGSADITVTAAAGTLTGSTLASGVTASSLTSVGTLTALTMGGTVSMADNVISRPRFTDYAETYTTPSISTNTLTLNIENGNVFRVSLNANITTLTISNPSGTGNACSFTLIFDADGTARTVTWPAAVKWPGGTAPTLTSTSSRSDVFVFYTNNAGTTWYAMTAAQNFVTS